ncbi:MAG TPA: alpha/beta hydrolase [Candidatus Saccharimonadales bacterium]|nr:alpha/beta hydrolase [Candidatus Saccharimonadales bacterium]
MKVFIIHGWTYNLSKWIEFCKELEKDGHEAVQLRVPGLVAPGGARAWTIKDYVDWLREELKAEKSPIVVGHSNGGRIALNYAVKYPKHLQRLILIDSAGVPSPMKKTKKAAIKLAKIGKPLASIPGSRWVFHKTFGGRDYYKAEPNMRVTMTNMLESDKQLDLSKVSTPVNIIWGENDTTTPLTMGKTMNQKISGSKLQVIGGAQHSPFFSHPKEVANIVSEIIETSK